MDSRTESLQASWREYFARAANEAPPHPGPRDALQADLCAAMARLVPADASVLEVGCGHGDLLASLPNAVRHGVDFLPERVAAARLRHPDIAFDVADGTSLGAQGQFGAVICDRLSHSVLDVQGLLNSLRAATAPDGRIYLTAFNALWELPTRLAEMMGLKVPAPTANWFSHSDFLNLFDLTDLEMVRFEDRMLLPLEVPVVGPLLNRYGAKMPGAQPLTMYRVYVLRRRQTAAVPRQATVSVVVPARNEAGNMQAAVDRTPVMGGGTELIFVEGGSSDGTWERIQDILRTYRGPLKLAAYQQTGKGKGDAVRLGFGHATGDLLMILDADLTVPPEDLPRFYDVMVQGRCDYVHGTRLVYPMEPGAMRFFNKLGNIAFSRLFSFLLQQPIKDTLCGTKVIWRRDWERLAAARAYFGDFDPFGDFDLIFGASRFNLKISEIPIRYRDRTYGETNISRWKHGWLLLKMSAVAARKLRFA